MLLFFTPYRCVPSNRQIFIYEEFMARSSTRQALSQGSNFMGMMNVLMQLRKVCNHPDLFEPRSVVTPLIVDPIYFTVPSCVVGMTSYTGTSVFRGISESLLCPLWCGSESQPSLSAASRHDETQSDELLLLEATLDVKSLSDEVIESTDHAIVCFTLKGLFTAVVQERLKQRLENIHFLHQINEKRCRAARFAYPQQLIDHVLLPDVPIQRSKSDVIFNPMQLLAMRKDLNERADDVSGLLKRFVFAVPKANAHPVILDTNIASFDSSKNTEIHSALSAACQELLRPFREAHTRLTTFFPDKRLVQFDAGKLQALAELLRERKSGGHKVLIFTQMSKMLDILEAFLNMNGHTYVRLDGGTSIDQRQRLMDRFNNDSKIFCFILSTRSGGTGVNLTGADTVVFYDSDWNPAQDAQAQDRAHR
jgi:SNF2 family DNA or RNA helicase